VPDDVTPEDEVRRLRAELERERELRVAAETLAAEREALAEAAKALAPRRRRRSFREPSRHRLRGNWMQ
jgi:hypothetical protein